MQENLKITVKPVAVVKTVASFAILGAAVSFAAALVKKSAS